MTTLFLLPLRSLAAWPRKPMSTTATHRVRGSATLLALITVALLGACNRADERTAAQEVSRATAPAPAGSSAASTKRDADITTEVAARMSRDPQLSHLNIDVATRGGNVLLRGSAPDTGSRSLATEVARAVDHVVGVDNQMNVQQKN
jgi:osmotically-inducible protein OsmY